MRKKIKAKGWGNGWRDGWGRTIGQRPAPASAGDSLLSAGVASSWLKVGDCGRNVGSCGLAIGVLGRG